MTMVDGGDALKKANKTNFVSWYGILNKFNPD